MAEVPPVYMMVRSKDFGELEKRVLTLEQQVTYLLMMKKQRDLGGITIGVKL